MHGMLGYIYQFVHGNNKSPAEEMGFIGAQVEQAKVGGTAVKAFEGIKKYCDKMVGWRASGDMSKGSKEDLLISLLPFVTMFVMCPVKPKTLEEKQEVMKMSQGLIAWFGTLGFGPLPEALTDSLTKGIAEKLGVAHS